MLLLIPQLLLLHLIGLSSTVTAQQDPKPQVVQTYKSTPARYRYLGCYNETTSLANTSGERALYGGINWVDADAMTVEKCWKFCARSDAQVEYKYAGLEYAR